jgi:hypothetical protein
MKAKLPSTAPLPLPPGIESKVMIRKSPRRGKKYVIEIGYENRQTCESQ